MAIQVLVQNTEDPDPTQHLLNIKCLGDCHTDQAPVGEIIYNHLVTMTRTETITPTQPNNIWRILEFKRDPMMIFTINFRPEQFNYNMLAPSAEWLSEDT